MKYRVDTVELRKEMVSNGFLHNYQLANVSGVGKDTIGKILSGHYNPSYIVIKKISSALSLSPSRAGEIFFAHNLPIA